MSQWLHFGCNFSQLAFTGAARLFFVHVQCYRSSNKLELEQLRYTETATCLVTLFRSLEEYALFSTLPMPFPMTLVHSVVHCCICIYLDTR